MRATVCRPATQTRYYQRGYVVRTETCVAEGQLERLRAEGGVPVLAEPFLPEL